MSFVVREVDTVEARVRIQTPQGMGKVKKEEVIATFKKLSAEEMQELAKKLNPPANSEDDFNEEDQDRDVVYEILSDNTVDVTGFKDEDGNDIGFTAEVHNRCLSMTHYRAAAFRSFLSVQTDGRLKN